MGPIYLAAETVYRKIGVALKPFLFSKHFELLFILHNFGKRDPSRYKRKVQRGGDQYVQEDPVGKTVGYAAPGGCVFHWRQASETLSPQGLYQGGRNQ